MAELYIEYSDRLGPREELAVARDLHLCAERWARNAYRHAEEEGIDIGGGDPEPESLDIGPLPATYRRLGVPLDFAIAHARRSLAIPNNATTADVAAAVKAIEEQRPAVTAAREAIAGAVQAARAASHAAANMPEMRTVAWLLGRAAELAAFATTKRVSDFRYGKHHINQWLRAVESVQAADPSIGQRDALRLILSATDSHESTKIRARWDGLLELVESRVKTAKQRNKSQR